MNYLKVYCNLIRKAENRTPPEGYTEKHHIFPKSIFGNNDKTVVLTSREHYIAHALLEKIYIKRYGIIDERTSKMVKAHTIMKSNGKYINSYLYEGARIRASYANKGRKVSEETKRKIGDIHRGKKLSEQHKEILKERIKGKNNPNNPRYGKNLEGEQNPFYGKTHSQEQKEKWSKERRSVKLSKEHKRKISEFNKNKKLSEDTIKKIVDAKRKHYKFVSPSGEVVEEYTTLTNFSKQNKLDLSRLSQLSRGIIKQYNGWTLYEPSQQTL
jgi:hypothetical protein